MHFRHEDNCPPKLQNTIWWVAPLLPFLGLAYLAVKAKSALRRQKGKRP